MQVVDAKPEHFASLRSKPLRQADVDEWVIGSGGRTVDYSLKYIKENPGPYQRAFLNDKGECICIWGLKDHRLWLIATVEAEKVGKSIHRYAYKELAALHAIEPTLVAIAYARNELHLTWLTMLGFKLVDAGDVLGHPFVHFERTA